MTNLVNDFVCRACGGRQLALIKASTIATELRSSDFAITDSAYGVTASLFRCPDCGLVQCPEATDVLSFYEGLEDPRYEEGRGERLLQGEALIRKVLLAAGRESGAGLKLLDVGAGSGVLVEAARKYGFEAVGVEPSSWLAGVARDRGLQVFKGVLPHPALPGPFDVVMLIDVIEHVTAPLSLLREVGSHLKPGGIALVVTPDVSALFARLLGYKWWHYRIAHISYFNRKTLQLITERAGLRVRGFHRPGWYFSYPYLRERLCQYLPSWLLPPAIGPLRRAVIPLNLRDSLLMVCERP
jgi:SAM-dependent methyltransferase